MKKKKQKKERQNKQKKNNFIKIIESPHTICGAFCIFAIVTLIFAYYQKVNTNYYVFSGYNDNISLDSGGIYLGTDIHYFNAANILYTGENYKIKSYEMGYYLEDGTKISSISSDSSDDEVYQLKSILENNILDIEEMDKGSLIFTKSVKKNMSKIYFKMTVITEKDKKIEENIELNVEKLTN